MKTLQTDILVCGGGCAGIAVALSSARHGAKTLLVERAGFSGGIVTTVGLPYFDGLIDNPSGRLVVKGIPLELLSTIKVVVAASVAVPFLSEAAELSSVPESGFVPENDYPFFGCEPESFA